MHTVLHIITTISRGGAENHLASLAIGQKRRNWRVVVAYLKGDGYWKPALEQAGVEVHALQWSGYGDFRVIGRIQSFIDSVRPDVVHAHLPAPEVLTRLARRTTAHRRAFVISKHSDDPLATPIFWLGGFWAERAADEIIAISGAVQRYLIQQHRLPKSRIHVIHYGLEPDSYDRVTNGEIAALRQEWQVRRDDLVVGVVARLAPQKRIDLLIEAVSGARNRGFSVKLVVAGTGAKEAELRQLVNEKGLEDSVVWLGHREDIERVMLAFDVFALVSDYEGFGLVLLEAMAASRPIIATRVSAIPEIVVDGETGLLCSAGQVEGIVDSLESMRDVESRQRMGQAGRNRLEEYFAVDRMIDETIDIYMKSIMKQESSPGSRTSRSGGNQ